MEITTKIVIGLVAFEHLYFLWLEMFAWETAGRRTFKSLPAELFEPTKVLAANQGLYNGFLAAGLIWTFFISDEKWRMNFYRQQKNIFHTGNAGTFGNIEFYGLTQKMGKHFT
jgi:uncharacterized membrane protein